MATKNTKRHKKKRRGVPPPRSRAPACLSSCYFVFFVAILCAALSGSRLCAAEAEAPSFTAALADGSRVRGTLQELRADWSVTLQGDKATEVRGSELITLRRSTVPL